MFDLSKHKPADVLSKLYGNLDQAEKRGDARATRVRKGLRVLACGGDGTVAWILTTVWCGSAARLPPLLLEVCYACISHAPLEFG